MGGSISKKGKYDPYKNNKKKKGDQLVIKTRQERDHFFHMGSQRRFQDTKPFSQTLPNLSRIPDDDDSFPKRRVDPKTRLTLDHTQMYSETSMRSDDYETISVSLHNIPADYENIYEEIAAVREETNEGIDEEIALIDMEEVVQKVKLIKKRIQNFDGSEEYGVIVEDLNACTEELNKIGLNNEQTVSLRKKIEQFKQAVEKQAKQHGMKQTQVAGEIKKDEIQKKTHYQLTVELFADITNQLDDIKEEILNYYGTSEDQKYGDIMDKLNRINAVINDVDERNNVNITLTKEQYEDYVTRLKRQFEVIVLECEKEFKCQKDIMSAVKRSKDRRRRSEILESNINIKEVHRRLSIDNASLATFALAAGCGGVIEEETEDQGIYENVFLIEDQKKLENINNKTTKSTEYSNLVEIETQQKYDQKGKCVVEEIEYVNIPVEKNGKASAGNRPLPKTPEEYLYAEVKKPKKQSKSPKVTEKIKNIQNAMFLQKSEDNKQNGIQDEASLSNSRNEIFLNEKGSLNKTDFYNKNVKAVNDNQDEINKQEAAGHQVVNYNQEEINKQEAARHRAVNDNQEKINKQEAAGHDLYSGIKKEDDLKTPEKIKETFNESFTQKIETFTKPMSPIQKKFLRQLSTYSTHSTDDEFFDCEEFLDSNEFSVREVHNVYKIGSYDQLSAEKHVEPLVVDATVDEGSMLFMDQTPPDEKPTFKSLFGRTVSERSSSQDSEVRNSFTSDDGNFEDSLKKKKRPKSATVSAQNAHEEQTPNLHADEVFVGKEERLEENDGNEPEKDNPDLIDASRKRVKNPRKVSRITMKYIDELKNDYVENLRNLSPAIGEDSFSFYEKEENNPTDKENPSGNDAQNYNYDEIDNNVKNQDFVGEAIYANLTDLLPLQKHDEQGEPNKSRLSQETPNKNPNHSEKFPSFIQLIPDSEVDTSGKQIPGVEKEGREESSRDSGLEKKWKENEGLLGESINVDAEPSSYIGAENKNGKQEIEKSTNEIIKDTKSDGINVQKSLNSYYSDDEDDDVRKHETFYEINLDDGETQRGDICEISESFLGNSKPNDENLLMEENKYGNALESLEGNLTQMKSTEEHQSIEISKSLEGNLKQTQNDGSPSTEENKFETSESREGNSKQIKSTHNDENLSTIENSESLKQLKPAENDESPSKFEKQDSTGAKLEDLLKKQLFQTAKQPINPFISIAGKSNEKPSSIKKLITKYEEQNPKIADKKGDNLGGLNINTGINNLGNITPDAEEGIYVNMDDPEIVYPEETELNFTGFESQGNQNVESNKAGFSDAEIDFKYNLNNLIDIDSHDIIEEGNENNFQIAFPVSKEYLNDSFKDDFPTSTETLRDSFKTGLPTSKKYSNDSFKDDFPTTKENLDHSFKTGVPTSKKYSDDSFKDDFPTTKENLDDSFKTGLPTSNKYLDDSFKDDFPTSKENLDNSFKTGLPTSKEYLNDFSTSKEYSDENVGISMDSSLDFTKKEKQQSLFEINNLKSEPRTNSPLAGFNEGNETAMNTPLEAPKVLDEEFGAEQLDASKQLSGDKKDAAPKHFFMEYLNKRLKPTVDSHEEVLGGETYQPIDWNNKKTKRAEEILNEERDKSADFHRGSINVSSEIFQKESETPDSQINSTHEFSDEESKQAMDFNKEFEPAIKCSHEYLKKDFDQAMDNVLESPANSLYEYLDEEPNFDGFETSINSRCEYLGKKHKPSIDSINKRETKINSSNEYLKNDFEQVFESPIDYSYGYLDEKNKQSRDLDKEFEKRCEDVKNDFNQTIDKVLESPVDSSYEYFDKEPKQSTDINKTPINSSRENLGVESNQIFNLRNEYNQGNEVGSSVNSREGLKNKCEQAKQKHDLLNKELDTPVNSETEIDSFKKSPREPIYENFDEAIVFRVKNPKNTREDFIPTSSTRSSSEHHSSLEYLDEARDTVSELPSLSRRSFLVDSDLSEAEEKMQTVTECLDDIKICIGCFEGSKNDEEYHSIYENLFSTMSALNSIKSADWDVIQRKQELLQEITRCMAELEGKVV